MMKKMKMNNNPWDSIIEPENSRKFNGYLADKNNPLDFYWAKDINNNSLFILITNVDITSYKNIPKIKGIDISFDKIDNQNQLIFHLLHKKDEDIFFTLCKDLLSITDSFQNEDLAIRTIFKRVESWQYFLRNAKELIDKRQLKGLIGELYLIKKYLLKNYKPEEIFSFWIAPLGSVQDFELNNMTIEVKTKSSVNSITISSYEQLYSELDYLYLFVVTLSESSENITMSFNIINLIDEIKDLIGRDNLLLIEHFDKLLFQYGLLNINEYKDIYFIITSDEFYLVSKSFPRISEIPAGIDNLTYKINLDYCREFKIEKNIFI